MPSFNNGLKISVCIPVYNCAEFLGQALDSILPQTDDRIEVVVYDGGSTDGTPELMSYYSKAWANLRYHRDSHRGGIDADLATCVGFAQGEYCWLFSGDDVMRPGAIERALNWLNEKHDILICNHTICNKEMVISHVHTVLQPDQAFTANLANKEERLEWFRRAVTSEAYFSFLSGLIVRREKWHNGTLHEAFNRSCWGHVARVFGLISSGLKVCYVAEVWLDQRGENDSFMDKGIVNRIRIGIEGYHMLADNFFGHDSIEAFHIRRVIRHEFPLMTMLYTKVQCHLHPEKEDRVLLDRLAKLAYCDNSPAILSDRLIYLATSYRLFVVVRFAYRAFKKIRRIL